MEGQFPEYSFALEQWTHWESYLEKHGYCVIRAVANAEDIALATDEFWTCFESKTEGLKRDDHATWDRWRVDKRGIVLQGEVLQCAGAWRVRALPRVKQAFSRIWKEEDLIVSMDSTLLWLPWWENAKWTPRTEGLHLDQNPWNKPGRCCIQGMVPLLDVTAETGGLQVVPDSHTDEAKEAQKSRYRHWNGAGDFCTLFGNDPLQKNAKLVLANAGDLILWDSRTVHGGLVGTGNRDIHGKLARLTQTVCMVPRQWATADVLQWRREAFAEGVGTTHWPQEGRQSCYSKQGYIPITLNEDQQKLL